MNNVFVLQLVKQFKTNAIRTWISTSKNHS